MEADVGPGYIRCPYRGLRVKGLAKLKVQKSRRDRAFRYLDLRVHWASLDNSSVAG